MKLLTAKQVAVAWQISPARVYELVRRGLPVVRLGTRQIRFEESRLKEFLETGGTREVKEDLWRK